MVFYCEFVELLEISEEESKVFKFFFMVYFYIFYMYCVVLGGNFVEILVVLLLCYWLYYEVGEKLL